MTEVWQYAIPVTIALGGLFHFLLAELFTTMKEHKAMVMAWIFFAFLLMIDSLVGVHLIAQDTVSADLTIVTRAAYLLGLGSFAWTALYFIIMAMKGGIEEGDSMLRGRR